MLLTTVVIQRGNEFLSVERGDSAFWQLPYGLVEHGEDLMEAAVRLLKDQTQIVVARRHLLPVYTGHYCDPIWGRCTTVAMYATSYIGPALGDHLAWHSRDELLKGPQGDYSRRLFKSLDILRNFGCL